MSESAREHNPPVAGRFLLWVDARRWWLFALAAALHLVSFNGLWRIGADSAVFRTVARNLYEGSGFVCNEQVCTRINPGFPYLLASLFRLTGESALASLLLVHGLGLASLGLVYILIRRDSGRPLAVLITFLTAINVTFLRHCIEILADVPFLFACTLALLGFDLATRPAASGARPLPRNLILGALLIGLGLAFAASLRIVFLAPVAAILVDLLWRARRSRAKWLLLAGALAVVGLALGIRLSDPRMASGMTLLPKEREMLDHLANASGLLAHIRDSTLAELAFNITPRAVFGNKSGIWPVDASLTLVVVISGLALVRRHVLWGILVAILFLQCLFFYADTRYFLPIIPLLMLGWWDAAAFLAARVPPRWANAALLVPIVVLAGANLARCIGFAVEQRRAPFLRSYLKGRYEGFPEIASQASERLPADAVLVAGDQLSEPLHFFTRRRTIATFETSLLEPVPTDRPVFVLLPADPKFQSALARAGLICGEPVLSVPRAANSTPLTIAPVTSAPAPR